MGMVSFIMIIGCNAGVNDAALSGDVISKLLGSRPNRFLFKSQLDGSIVGNKVKPGVEDSVVLESDEDTTTVVSSGVQTLQGAEIVQEEDKQEKIVLTNEETLMLNSLLGAFNGIKNAYNHVLYYPKTIINVSRRYSKYGDKFIEQGLALLKEAYDSNCLEYTKIVDNYGLFVMWVNDDPSYQKELVGAFTKTYNFLIGKKNIHASNEDIDLYIKNAIQWYEKQFMFLRDKSNRIKDLSRGGIYGENSKNYIYDFFSTVIRAGFRDIDFSKTEAKQSLLSKIKYELTNQDLSRVDWKN
ncbi:Mlp lipoprotein family protein [Borrelia duttonii CR2A]|uniref:Mlp lipoprotein family protein n=1 Tax=Borrelia duttonii CR2A TaxID=1432657 RepID=W6TEQ3_9SPIR|nr:Mlp family lipoprotein [Borrelia duttonii]ETZ17047.1 Mlp lipoprotein family protein [Borrelia duttonii CR2A]